MLDDRADLDLLDPELRRWAVYVLGVALLGLLDDALGRGAAAAARAGWRGHARAVARGALLDRGDQGGRARSALAAYATSGLGRHGLGYVADLALLLLTTNLFNLLDLRPGRVEKAFAALLARALRRRLDGRAARPARASSSGPVLVGAAFTLRERAMLGDTGSNLVGALAGISLLVTLGRHGPAGRAGASSRRSTLYGEFRSISRTIEGDSAASLSRLAGQS